jgi:TonB family protein
MPDYRRQDEDGGFKKTFLIIAIVHLVLLGGLLLATLFRSKPSNDSVVWMTPGSFGGDSTAMQSPATSSREPAPPPSEEPTPLSPQKMDQREEPAPSPPEPTPPRPTPPPAVEESELPISTPKPTLTPTPTPTPRPTPTPAAKPSPKPTPKPAPKPTPKPSPSPARSPTPKSSPKPEVSSKEKEKDKPRTDASPTPKTSPAKSESKEKPGPSASDAQQAQENESKGKRTHDQISGGPSSWRSGSGSERDNGEAAGAGDSALSAYVGILTNRFQAAWNQPTSEMALGKTLEVTVKLKVEPDGTVTEFDIVEGSGNTVVDDSVREAGKKIARLPPPPNGQAFSAPVHFELGN